MRGISLGELAQAGAVSKEHVARLFRRRYGVGPVTALELVRLDRAETLLARTNFSVTAIAHSCGYADPLHFSWRFRSTHAHRRATTAATALGRLRWRRRGCFHSLAGSLPIKRRRSGEAP